MRIEWITFVETDAFMSRIKRYGLESALRDLQVELVEKPERGDLDPGTGGLRKIRMADPARSKGKRGGIVAGTADVSDADSRRCHSNRRMTVFI